MVGTFGVSGRQVARTSQVRERREEWRRGGGILVGVASPLEALLFTYHGSVTTSRPAGVQRPFKGPVWWVRGKVGRSVRDLVAKMARWRVPMVKVSGGV